MQLPKPLVLASASPRRIHLLRLIGVPFTVSASHVPEEFSLSSSAEENARTLALDKAREVGRMHTSAVVVGADTIVVLDGELLGKPATPGEAEAMLARLSGRTHTVVTGIALVDRPSDRFITDLESTRVTFRPLPADEIRNYVAGGSPLDKAGAYGIQDDYGALFVTRIEGCFYNVVGFPLAKFYVRLREFLSLNGKDAP